MTIEERAEEYRDKIYKNNFYQPIEANHKQEGYIQGASDQKQIDIDKAWNYISGMIDYVMSGGDITHITRDNFFKAIEE